MMFEYIYNLALDKRNDFFSNLIKPLLFLLSLFYGLIIRILRYIKLKKNYKFPCKVISVGNIVLGGTGKTPLVEYIALFLKEKKNIAILSRGHALAQDLTDEPAMIRERLNIPVIVDKNRIRAIHKAVKDYNVDTAILDDGFQQWQINKDLDIITLDAECPFGNNRLIPRGTLREPLDGLRRADMVVLTKIDPSFDNLSLKNFLKKLNPQLSIFEADYLPKGFYKIKDYSPVSNSYLLGKKAILISAIAKPESFERLVLNLGIEVVQHIRFPDHHCYREKDIEMIRDIGEIKRTDFFITTEKDAIKLKKLNLLDLEIFVLSISLKIKDEETFFKRILSLYNY